MASAPAVGCGITWLNRWSLRTVAIRRLVLRCATIAVVACYLARISALGLAGEPVFDALQLRDRTSCVGVLLGRDGQYAYLAVRRAAAESGRGSILGYLKKADDDEKIAYEQLRDRTQAMLKEPEHDAYRFVLDQELQRATRWLSGEDRTSSELVLLSIPTENIAKVELASRENNALALWAWRKQIDAPELSEGAKLREALQQEKVDWRQDPPDLGSRFQAVPQDGDEWRARIALVRFSRDRSIEFQGTPGMMVRIGDRNAPADVAKLLAQGVQQQSQDLLGELLDGRKPKRRDWRESCQEMLTEDRDDYYRASCMEQDVGRSDGSVESAFVVRLGTAWKTIWKASIPVDIHAVPNEALQQIENDPQIRSLRSLVQSLGVGTQDAVDRAMKMGAATMQAQSLLNQKFEFYRQRYQHRLDLPVLRWDVSPPERRSGR